MISKVTNIKSIVSQVDEKYSISSLEDHEILIEDGIIRKIALDVGKAEEEIDADGAIVTPGFIDSHTHPIFCSNRANEFKMRTSGMSYKEIAQSGGGIVSSIQDVRSASEDELFQYSLEHTNFFLDNGTTTIEAKSGYGLTTQDELKSLRVIKRLNEASPLDIIPTFMGAHAFPPEYSNNHDAYIDLICEEMIPAVAEEELAEFCDVFCEKGYFTVEQSRKILETAKRYNLIPRLHADEFIDSGAAELAAEIGAISADHLMAVSDNGIQKLAESNVIATLLPGTTLFLGSSNYAPGRKLIEAGCDIALATDFNPGSCTLQSMPIVISLSNLYCGLTIEEAIVATTSNAAKAINRQLSIGKIQKGYQADLLFWGIDSIEEIPYWLGSDRILSVMKKGELVEG